MEHRERYRRAPQDATATVEQVTEFEALAARLGVDAKAALCPGKLNQYQLVIIVGKDDHRRLKDLAHRYATTPSALARMAVRSLISEDHVEGHG